MTTLPAGAHLTEIRGGGTHRHPTDPATTEADNLFDMNGPGVYRMALPRSGAVIDRAIAKPGLDGRGDIDLVIPHQASGRALAAPPRFGFPVERVVNVLAEYGNCVAASIPMALAIANREGRLKPGDRVLLVGTGAGLSIAAAVLRW